MLRMSAEVHLSEKKAYKKRKKSYLSRCLKMLFFLIYYVILEEKSRYGLDTALVRRKHDPNHSHFL